MNASDVIVVGGGHAGCEAAAAAARMGARTTLVTHCWEAVGAMSCNPAIGGLGKGHLVREVDAFDGVMGRAIDRAGIQFRILNRRKGPAVQGPRAQADRALYRQAVQALLQDHANLNVVEGEATGLIRDGAGVHGVTLSDGETLPAAAVVLTTGTFLRGRMHWGGALTEGGRAGAPSAEAMATALAEVAGPMGRLKTGTPPRLDGRTIDWAALTAQPGDEPPQPFSVLTDAITTPQINCYITRTTGATHGIINDNLDRSALYGGRIESVGPRYCPSIEDKIVRFPDRDSHQVFLEPEGLDDPTVYPNGISTSLPEDVQTALVQTIPGLENAAIVQAGYAIEYDFVDPRKVRHNLMVEGVPGLFLAGQIMGTTGYEEAAALGLVAGVNAARAAGGNEPDFVIGRTEGYTGVMIDDLVTLGTREPYRMFTSRAEYRLHLRADNADRRLTDKGIQAGCVGAARQAAHERRMATLAEARQRLGACALTSEALSAAGLSRPGDGRARSAADLLGDPGVTVGRLAEGWPALKSIPAWAAAQLETEALYGRYLERQERDMASLRQDESLVLPGDLDYGAIGGLSNEVRSKLEAVRPETIGQAARIPGVTPAGVTALLAYAQKKAG